MIDVNLLLSRPGALRVIPCDYIGDPFEDWSCVRSPSRAERRRRLGHPQRVVTRYRANGNYIHDRPNNCVYAHPDDIVRLERALGEMAV